MRLRLVRVTCDDCAITRELVVEPGVETPEVPVGWTHDDSGIHRCQDCTAKTIASSPPLVAGRDLPADFWIRVAAAMRVVPSPYRKTATVLAAPIRVAFEVDTPEGRMTAEAGDYLVTDDPPTHAWPVRRAVFEATHAYVEEAS